MVSSLLPFFKPRGVVVIGASTSPEKLGYGIARNLVQSGYPGAIHFVGQKHGELFQRPLYSDLSQVPDPVDLALLAVPPNIMPKTIEACGKRGIRAAIISSAGFREVSAEGAALEQGCLDVARSYNMRLLGPNCIGTIDTHFPLDTSFLQPPMPAPGHMGFISQSGAFCAGIIDWSRREGCGFSQIISLGNQLDVNETEALSALADDEHTRVIVLYMESVSDGSRPPTRGTTPYRAEPQSGQRFVEVAREVTQRKPVIALKAGRFESGQKAAASHTGALAAADVAFDAAFEKAGILRADSAEQMFDWARALESYPNGLEILSSSTHDPISHGKGIAILTDAGGPGVIAADSLEKNGLQLAKFNETTRKALIASLPPSASVLNPVDMLASASPETYASCLKILVEDDNVEGVLVILPPPPMYKAEDVAEKIVEILESSGLPDSRIKKPVVIALMGSTLVEQAAGTFQGANIPTYPFPERAASALGALVKRAESLDRGPQTVDQTVHRPQSTVSLLPEELLAAYGIETAPLKLARSMDEAKLIASELGYPVVMKVASPDILHKSDVGGVGMDIKDADALQIAYTRILKQVRETKPEAQIEGIHIQSQVLGGQEVIVGAVRDPQFGPLMMFGSGGVEVEGLKDVAFALAPLSQVEAQKMIRKTWAGRKLKGFRQIAPADEEAVVEALIKLSYLLLENEAIHEVEINPLKALSKGAIAIDVRVK